MELVTDDIRATLLENGARYRQDSDFDPVPVVKFFTPDAAATWLIVSADPEDPSMLYGLCDLGIGFPETGTVHLSELQELRGRLGLSVERDLYFRPDRPISAYVRDAISCDRIVC
jgi:hypothetical protein